MARSLKPEFSCQTVLPDRSILKGQKLVENDKIEKLKCDILGDFQTLCKCVLWIQSFIKIGQRSLILGYLNFRAQNTLHFVNFSCECLNLWSHIKIVLNSS